MFWKLTFYSPSILLERAQGSELLEYDIDVLQKPPPMTMPSTTTIHPVLKAHRNASLDIAQIFTYIGPVDSLRQHTPTFPPQPPTPSPLHSDPTTSQTTPTAPQASGPAWRPTIHSPRHLLLRTHSHTPSWTSSTCSTSTYEIPDIGYLYISTPTARPLRNLRQQNHLYPDKQ